MQIEKPAFRVRFFAKTFIFFRYFSAATSASESCEILATFSTESPSASMAFAISRALASIPSKKELSFSYLMSVISSTSLRSSSSSIFSKDTSFMNLAYRSFCKYCGEKVFIATIRSKSQIATLESLFLALLGEEPEKVANEQLFHLFYVGLVLLEHLEKVRPFLWRKLCVEGVEMPPHLGKSVLHVDNHLLHFFFEFVRFDSWYKVAHRRRKGSNPYMTKNDATEDLYFGLERDTAKPEKWHNARHRTPHGRMTPVGETSPLFALRCSLPPPSPRGFAPKTPWKAVKH